MSNEKMMVYGKGENDLDKFLETMKCGGWEFSIFCTPVTATLHLKYKIIDGYDHRIVEKYISYFPRNRTFGFDDIRNLHVIDKIDMEQLVFRVPDDIGSINKILGIHKKEKFVFKDLNIMI